MADDLTFNKQQAFLTRCNQCIDAAPTQVSALKVNLEDCNNNWLGYAAIQADSEKLTAAAVAFSGRCQTAWTGDPNKPADHGCKPDLEAALDVLAGGMGTTRNALLDSMKTE